MAKKKITEDVVPVAEQAITKEVEPQKENTVGAETEEPQPKEEAQKVEGPINKEQPEADGAEKQPKADAQPPVETPIPDDVRAYLERHPEEEAVYIDKLGGVFSSKTPKVFLKDAVLYHNPFFKQ